MQDTYEFGLGGLFNETSNFTIDGRDKKLGSPALNISVSCWNIDIISEKRCTPGEKGMIGETWTRSNKTLGIEYINGANNTKCQSLGVSHYLIMAKYISNADITTRTTVGASHFCNYSYSSCW